MCLRFPNPTVSSSWEGWTALPLHIVSEARLRTACKEAIEALGLWLRRVIEIDLRPAIGDDYVNSQTNGPYIFKTVWSDKVIGLANYVITMTTFGSIANNRRLSSRPLRSTTP